jgi:hypothetical protein
MAGEKLVLNGVGKGYLIGVDGTLEPLVELQDMTIEINSTMEKVYGGDNLFPLYTFPKDKSATFNFTNATFSLDLLKLSQGAEITTAAVELFATETVTLSGTGTGTLSITSGVVTTAGATVVRDVVADALLSQVDATPTGNEFTISNAGAIACDVSMASKVVEVNYLYTVATGAQVADVKTTSVPGFVELRHESQPIDWIDGKKYVVQTRVFKARCDGKVSVEYKRGQAYAPKIAFEAVDPGRTDGKFIAMAIRELA